MKIQQVAIADDHQIFRQGLSMLLNSMPNIKVVAQAANGKELIEYLQKLSIDLVFLDINMPEMNGLETAQWIKNHFSGIKVVILTMHTDNQYIKSMLNAGISGYLLKTADNTQIEKAVNTIIHGNTFFSDEIKKIMSEEKQPEIETKEIALQSLTKRELEVLQLICQGITTQEIAEKLFLSHKTVEGHRSNLMLKTNTKNAVDLVIFAIKNKWIQI